MKGLFTAVLVFFLFTLSQGLALERFELVTTEEMQQLLADREAGKVDFILLNSLDAMIFRDAHIPGSINIPLSRVDSMIHLLGEDHDKLIVPY